LSHLRGEGQRNLTRLKVLGAALRGLLIGLDAKRQGRGKDGKRGTKKKGLPLRSLRKRKDKKRREEGDPQNCPSIKSKSEDQKIPVKSLCPRRLFASTREGGRDTPETWEKTVVAVLKEKNAAEKLNEKKRKAAARGTWQERAQAGGSCLLECWKRAKLEYRGRSGGFSANYARKVPKEKKKKKKEGGK